MYPNYTVSFDSCKMLPKMNDWEMLGYLQANCLLPHLWVRHGIWKWMAYCHDHLQGQMRAHHWRRMCVQFEWGWCLLGFYHFLIARTGRTHINEVIRLVALKTWLSAGTWELDLERYIGRYSFPLKPWCAAMESTLAFKHLHPWARQFGYEMIPLFS